jgi:hypothetical protein
MTPEQWAHEFESPPSFTACGHAVHSHPDITVSTRGPREGEATCLDCGHRWNEYPITLTDDEYDTLVAYMAFRLDNK